MTALPSQPEPGPEVGVTFARDADLPVIEELEAELADLRAELARIDAANDPDHPDDASQDRSESDLTTQPDGGID